MDLYLKRVWQGQQKVVYLGLSIATVIPLDNNLRKFATNRNYSLQPTK